MVSRNEAPASVVRHVRLPAEVSAELNELARRDNRTFSNFVAIVLTEYVNNNKEK